MDTTRRLREVLSWIGPAGGGLLVALAVVGYDGKASAPCGVKHHPGCSVCRMFCTGGGLSEFDEIDERFLVVGFRRGPKSPAVWRDGAEQLTER